MSPRLIAVLLLVAACAREPVVVEPEFLLVAIHDGDNQTAIGNTSLAAMPEVRVTTAEGTPRAGVTVRFEVTEGGGSATGTTAFTDGAGIARVGSWKLGAPGVQQRLTAFVPLASNSAVVFRADAITGPFHSFDTSNLAAEVPVGTVVPGAPAVIATDIAGNPVAGVPIRWTMIDGTLTSPPQSHTDHNGRATAGAWLLDTIAKLQRLGVRVELPGYATLPWMNLQFVVRATPGPVATIERLASEVQVAKAGDVAPESPRVRLRDQYGNLAYPRQVIFTVLSGGGVVDNTHHIAAPDGTAGVGLWRLGATPGENRLRVTADAATVDFVANGTP
jgi:hypothetical protein